MIFNMQSGGVVPDQYLEERTITPGTADQVINAGTYLRGAQTIKGDPDLIPANIKEGVDIFGVLGNMKNSGLYAWKKCIDYARVQAVTLPAYADAGSSSDKSATSYIGNFSNTPTIYSSESYTIDDSTGLFVLTGSISSHTPTSSSSSNYFALKGSFFMVGATTGNCMWKGVADTNGWLYWDSNNDYWLLNRYSQKGLAKVIPLRASGNTTTAQTTVALKSSGTIYYSDNITADTSGNITLSGTISSLAYSSSEVKMPAGKFFMIDATSSDLAFFSALTDGTYATAVSPYYGAVIANATNWEYIVIKKSIKKKTISYVVSENENEYPNGGVKDGYYYEKVAEGVKVATGTLTITSSNRGENFVIEHNMGVQAQVVVASTDDFNYGGYSVSGIWYLKSPNTWGYNYDKVNYRKPNSTSVSVGGIVVNDENEFSCTVESMETGTWEWYVIGGIEL